MIDWKVKSPENSADRQEDSKERGKTNTIDKKGITKLISRQNTGENSW